jgi:hypothetical protein
MIRDRPIAVAIVQPEEVETVSLSGATTTHHNEAPQVAWDGPHEGLYPEVHGNENTPLIPQEEKV